MSEGRRKLMEEESWKMKVLGRRVREGESCGKRVDENERDEFFKLLPSSLARFQSTSIFTPPFSNYFRIHSTIFNLLPFSLIRIPLTSCLMNN